MKTALVTGATTRLGRRISLGLASMGYSIALHYNTHPPGGLIQEIVSKGVECEGFRCDFRNTHAVEALIPDVLKSFPTLDLLVNNASIFEPSSVKETSLVLLESHFAINLMAPILISRDYANKVGRGSIINITDTKVASNTTAYAPYLLTKKGLADFTRISAKEFAPGIRVNAVAPGLILPHNGKEKIYFDKLEKSLPLKKRGATSDIVSAIRFLIENEFITGQQIAVDGGESLG